MAGCNPDPLTPIAHALLDCFTEQLAACGVPVCRANLVPGINAAFDHCCGCDDGGEGQAWVAVKQIVPQPVGGGGKCGWFFRATLELGIVRCAAAQDAKGNPPSPETLDAEGAAGMRDASIARTAILCCWAEVAGIDPGDWAIGTYLPLGPEGGCAGGATLVTVDFVDCGCS